MASARRREPADKVRLVDRGSADRQGKIYPNCPRTTTTSESQPHGGDGMEACQSVSTMPTSPEKFDPSVCCMAVNHDCTKQACKGSANSWQLSQSLAAVRPARHFPPHDCDETAACSSTQLHHIGRRLSSSGKPNHSSYLHCWCTAKLGASGPHPIT